MVEPVELQSDYVSSTLSLHSLQHDKLVLFHDAFLR